MKLFITIILTVFIAVQLFASTPKLIPVQGILSQADGSLINENIELSLSLFNAETGGDELWKEERTDFPVENGYISVYLGEVEEIDTSLITKAEELWLQIVFNGEKMPRVRLASVPFALEAINAQRIGNVTEAQINNMFNTACSDGYYIKGYDTNGHSICAEDKTGESQESVIYNAGNGISIDEDNKISISGDLYKAGTNIEITNNEISVKDNQFATTLHDHNNDYYEKVNEAENDSLVKLSGNPLNGYKLEKSEILETGGAVIVPNLTANGGIEIIARNDGSPTHEENGITSPTGNFTTLYSNYLNVAGETAANALRTKTILFANGANSWAGVSTTFKGMRSIYFDQIISSGENYSLVKQYLELDGSSDKGKLSSVSINALSPANSFCSLSNFTISGINGPTEAGFCRVSRSGNVWSVESMHSWLNVTCNVHCLVWNW